METQTKPQLQTISVKEYASKNNIKSIVPVVRTNENGYPYLTMINGDNVAENVYFSKAASVPLAAGIPVTKEFLAVYQIGITTNSAGEERIKLVSNSARVDIAGLLD